MGGTVRTRGAKLSSEVTPARTSRSATPWAAQPGVVITPMSGRSAARSVAISSMWRTFMPRISSPTTAGSTSKSAVTWQPREANAAELVRARPRFPMPTMATDQFSSTPRARSICAMRNPGS